MNLNVYFQKYYISVTAVSDGGNTTVSSDGVTVVIENDVLAGVVIYDGEPCNSTGNVYKLCNTK